MFAKKSVLAIIPARGGSKGVPRKNIREIAGKPLIAWTIASAKKSRYIDRLILSSEDAEIIAVAKKYGCEVPFIRPKQLAKDGTPGVAPVIHAVNSLPCKYDLIVLLQPTSPLRSAEDIDACIKRCAAGGFKSCVTVAEPDKSPFWMFRVAKSGLMRPLLKAPATCHRRQDLPAIYAVNGAVYVAERKWLLKTRSLLDKNTIAVKMPVERSLDIDTELDLQKMRAYLKYGRGRGML